MVATAKCKLCIVSKGEAGWSQKKSKKSYLWRKTPRICWERQLWQEKGFAILLPKPMWLWSLIRKIITFCRQWDRGQWDHFQSSSATTGWKKPVGCLFVCFLPNKHSILWREEYIWWSQLTLRSDRRRRNSFPKHETDDFDILRKYIYGLYDSQNCKFRYLHNIWNFGRFYDLFLILFLWSFLTSYKCHPIEIGTQWALLTGLHQNKIAIALERWNDQLIICKFPWVSRASAIQTLGKIAIRSRTHNRKHGEHRKHRKHGEHRKHRKHRKHRENTSQKTSSQTKRLSEHQSESRQIISLMLAAGKLCIMSLNCR